MPDKCTKCGADLRDGVLFCTECGTKRQQTTVQQPTQPLEQKVHQSYQPQMGTQPVYSQSNPQQGYAQPLRDDGRMQYGYQGGYTPEPIPGDNSKYQPITTGGYIGIMLLMAIPVIGFILTLVWACGGCRKVNKRNLARASLIVMVIGLVLSLIIGIAVKSLVGSLMDTMENSIASTYGLTGEELELEEQLADLEGLGDLSDLLGALGALEGLGGE